MKKKLKTFKTVKVLELIFNSYAHIKKSSTKKTSKKHM